MPATAASAACPPCAPFSGVRDVLRAVALPAAGAAAASRCSSSLSGVPAWAAAPPSGCERADATPRSRPISDQGLRGYRALIRSLARSGAGLGVPLRWWSPWNEPNGTFFVSPQRAVCDRTSPPVSPVVYTKLARAMRDELQALPGAQHLVLAELAGLPGPRLRGSARRGVLRRAARRRGLLGRPSTPSTPTPSAASPSPRAGRSISSRRALDRRPCARDKPIWVTETGVGGPDVGGERTGGLASLRNDCRALDAALRRWDVDPRVEAAFQYTFRDDPAFPVGLADVGLTRTWPAYDEWLAWGGDRPAGGPAPDLPAACSAGA